MSSLTQEALDRAGQRAGLDAPFVLVVSTPSTMHDARQLATDGMPHGTTVVARHQTQGRGRLQRVWTAPTGSLAMTVLVRPQLKLADIGMVSLAAAIAVRRVIGPRFGIKWPNDVLGPDGRKVAGVLCELEARGRDIGFVLVGIGVNVSAAPAEVPHASCVEAYTDHPVDLCDVAAGVVRELLDVLATAERTPGAVIAEWSAGAVTIGKRVRIGGAEGVATGITTEGALIVGTDDGAALVVHSGDVLHVLPEETDVAGPSASK